MRSKLFAFAAILSTMFLSSCGYVDFYEEVEAPCKKNFEECHKAVRQILPFNYSTFQEAPWWFTREISKAFAVVAYYPLKYPPENRILGVAPYSIPLWHTRILNREDPHHKSLFNYLLNNIQEIRYEVPATDESHAAYYLPNWSLDGVVTFYSDGIYEGISEFNLAALVIHEARHGDGYFHAKCPAGNRDCDYDLIASEGLSITFLEMLIHGSHHILSKGRVVALGRKICELLKDDLLRLPAELKELVEQTACGSIDWDWLKAQEGLED